MQCPKCESDNKVKSGFKGKKQRCKCKDCGCNYTQNYLRNKSFKIKSLRGMFPVACYEMI